jgi:hypothetical protein
VLLPGSWAVLGCAAGSLQVITGCLIVCLCFVLLQVKNLLQFYKFPEVNLCYLLAVHSKLFVFISVQLLTLSVAESTRLIWNVNKIVWPLLECSWQANCIPDRNPFSNATLCTTSLIRTDLASNLSVQQLDVKKIKML